MSNTKTAQQIYAELYDVTVPDWKGEIDFYLRLAGEAKAKGQAVLDVACGTGRVTLPLARTGVNITGLDLSPEMLAVARPKSANMPNIRWVQGDMRAFELGEQFGLAYIAGHSFQNLLTADDQASCLECVRRHLIPGGMFVLHLDAPDFAWLGTLVGEKGGIYESGGEVKHPASGNLFRISYSWTYAPSTQTASVTTVWEEVAPDGRLLNRYERKSLPLHAVFRFEIEHLLLRTGFQVEVLYGDFLGGEYGDAPNQMIWVARAA